MGSLKSSLHFNILCCAARNGMRLSSLGLNRPIYACNAAHSEGLYYLLIIRLGNYFLFAQLSTPKMIVSVLYFATGDHIVDLVFVYCFFCGFCSKDIGWRMDIKFIFIPEWACFVELVLKLSVINIGPRQMFVQSYIFYRDILQMF